MYVDLNDKNEEFETILVPFHVGWNLIEGFSCEVCLLDQIPNSTRPAVYCLSTAFFQPGIFAFEGFTSKQSEDFALCLPQHFRHDLV